MPHPIQRACLAIALAALPCVAQAASDIIPGPGVPRFIVQFTTPEPPASLAPLRVHVVRRLGIGAHVVQSDVALSEQAAAALKHSLADRPDVAYVDTDGKVEPQSSAPNDTYYAKQDHLFGPNGIGAPRAWGITRGAGVRIAVVDSGVSEHPDLAGSFVGGYDFYDRDSHPFSKPCTGKGDSTHATIVAGTAIAISNNARGIAGVAPEVKAVPVQALPTCNVGLMSDVVDGISWSVGLPIPGVPGNPHPVEVVLLPIAMRADTCPASLQAAIDGAVARGATVVAAAGNMERDARLDTPANCANVGATRADGTHDADTNFGAGVDLAAPGYVHWPSVDDTAVQLVTGTSISASHVAGIVALAQSAAATPLTPKKMEAVLKAHATPFPSAMAQPLGTGIANAPATVVAAQAMATGAERLDGAFTLVARPLAAASGGSCMIVGNNGQSPRPELYDWQTGGAARHCGFQDADTVVANAQGAWDIRPITTSQGLVAHVIRSRVNGQCLIRKDNGYADHFSLHLWTELGADRTYCGWPSADALVANGQAAWYFDAPTRATVDGTSTLTMGLQTIRPGFGFLGFTGTEAFAPNVVDDGRAWTFTAWPLNVPREGGDYAVSSVQSGQCMRITGDDYHAGTAASTSCLVKRERFRWASGQFAVAGQVRCLRVVGGTAGHASTVGLAGCTGPARWRVESDGRVRSLTGSNDFCLDVLADGTSAITTVKCSANRGSQVFRFDPF